MLFRQQCTHTQTVSNSHRRNSCSASLFSVRHTQLRKFSKSKVSQNLWTQLRVNGNKSKSIPKKSNLYIAGISEVGDHRYDIGCGIFEGENDDAKLSAKRTRFSGKKKSKNTIPRFLDRFLPSQSKRRRKMRFIFLKNKSELFPETYLDQSRNGWRWRVVRPAIAKQDLNCSLMSTPTL